MSSIANRLAAVPSSLFGWMFSRERPSSTTQNTYQDRAQNGSVVAGTSGTGAAISEESRVDDGIVSTDDLFRYVNQLVKMVPKGTDLTKEVEDRSKVFDDVLNKWSRYNFQFFGHVLLQMLNEMANGCYLGLRNQDGFDVSETYAKHKEKLHTVTYQALHRYDNDSLSRDPSLLCIFTHMLSILRVQLENGLDKHYDGYPIDEWVTKRSALVKRWVQDVQENLEGNRRSSNRLASKESSSNTSSSSAFVRQNRRRNRHKNASGGKSDVETVDELEKSSAVHEIHCMTSEASSNGCFTTFEEFVRSNREVREQCADGFDYCHELGSDRIRFYSQKHDGRYGTVVLVDRHDAIFVLDNGFRGRDDIFVVAGYVDKYNELTEDHFGEFVLPLLAARSYSTSSPITLIDL